jgi:hypothetical protein
MNNCFDTGTIQAFLDGELKPAEASAVSAHIAGCDACAAELAAAEEESAFVFSVLEREVDTLVPTQRLWNKINESIEVERHSAPFWKKAWAFITVSFTNPSIAVAAVMVLVLGVVVTVFVDREQIVAPQSPTVASAPPRADGPSTTATAGPSSISPAGTPGQTVAYDTKRSERPVAVNAHYVASRRSDIDRPVADRNVQQAVYIPGEESYVKTIATLSQSVDGQKDSVLRPSERISYERDMAVVNDAIAKLRKEVRKNPKNESAKQVLYTSYQNKIDLLNSVSQREELVASLKD